MNTLIFPRCLVTLLLLSLLAPASALALPDLKTSRPGTDDDATLTLTLMTAAIRGDSRTRCSVTLVDRASEVQFTAGDEIVVKVWQSIDWGFDQEIWSTTAHAAGPGAIQQTWDCTRSLGDDEGTLKFYATAKITKDKKPWGWSHDEPSTEDDLNEVVMVQDDDWEDDSTPAQAHAAQLERIGNRVARNNQDWTRVRLAAPSRLEAAIYADFPLGALDVALFDEQAQPLQAVIRQDEVALTLAADLQAGVYLVRIIPRDQADFNWYDLQVGLGVFCSCEAGQIDTQACGNCGVRTRACADCQWGLWGQCANEGECGPAAVIEESCGNCGLRTRQCSAACTWGEFGACEGEGLCYPGELEVTEEECEAGNTRQRSCDEDCQWGEWNACSACPEGGVQDCYPGPAGTEGVGICKAGQQTCTDNSWGPCEGPVVPGEEKCGDALDSDCDGQPDPAGGCAPPVQIGDPCANDAACSTGMTCLGQPAPTAFEGGMCTRADCNAGICGIKAACVAGWGGHYCLPRCNDDDDCREAYHCGLGVEQKKVCLPACLADSDCPHPARPHCALATGLCQEDTGEGEGEGSGTEGEGEGSGTEGEGEGTPVESCEAGSSRACFCEDNRKGVQRCNNEGNGWFPCNCDEVPAEGEGEGSGGEGANDDGGAGSSSGGCALGGTVPAASSALLGLLGLLLLGWRRSAR